MESEYVDHKGFNVKLTKKKQPEEAKGNKFKGLKGILKKKNQSFNKKPRYSSANRITRH